MKYNQQSKVPLAVLAIGIVYGDIGTSPLYAVKEVFFGSHPIAVTPDNVFGVLSLVFWAFVLIVSLKYLLVVTRASQNGEGGILTLCAIAQRHAPAKLSYAVLLLGLLASGFFFGEAVITPAVSVLSAVEGIAVVEVDLAPYIMPVAIVIIACLFAVQSYGTERIGRAFAPIMLLWFMTLALLGVKAIGQYPAILHALNPSYAVDFILSHSRTGLTTLGLVVLSITGVEALYADMGHFGIKPIRKAWFALVMPALLLNYFGQGAYLLSSPEFGNQPFYNLVSKQWLWPLITLATLAAIIASQAVISGIFSLTRQAMNYGYLPALKIEHTSARSQGQIYVPFANTLLCIVVLFVMVRFQSSANLAAAYGIAVTAIMLISSLLTLVVAYYGWQWSLYRVVAFGCVFISLDLVLLSATLTKFTHGGWLPMVIGGGLFTVMYIWQQQRSKLILTEKSELSLVALSSSLDGESIRRAPGTAVYLSRETHHVPRSLLHNLKYNKTLHERNVILTFQYESIPQVHPCKRAEITQLSDSFWQVLIRVGYQESPDIEQLTHSCALKDLYLHPQETVFLMSSERIKSKGGSVWHEVKVRVFILMSKHALRTSERLRIPSDRLIEIGVYREL